MKLFGMKVVVENVGFFTKLWFLIRIIPTMRKLSKLTPEEWAYIKEQAATTIPNLKINIKTL